MKPHTPYYNTVKRFFGNDSLHGMAHITGGGIEGNLSRIMPCGLSARIDLSQIAVPLIFKFIKSKGGIADSEMLKTFNCGAGLVLVVAPGAEAAAIQSVSEAFPCYTVGEVARGGPAVVFEHRLNW
jgi:phosphoribosylformylglycinamidine cyclo-ligase